MSLAHQGLSRSFELCCHSAQYEVVNAVSFLL